MGILERIITALVILPLLYLLIMKLPPVYFKALLSIVSGLALYEFYTMYETKAVMKYAGVVIGVFYMFFRYDSIYAIFAASMLLFTLRLFYIRNPLGSLSDVSTAVIGLVYIPGLLSYQIYLMAYTPELILFLYGVIWSADSMALLIGKTIGRMKLYPAISPNKTVEGAIASVIGGIISALIIRKLLLASVLSIKYTIIAGFLIGSVTIIGDLVESMFKRDAGVKDSSGLVPGHGGFLDKIDGALFAGPALAAMLSLINIVHF